MPTINLNKQKISYSTKGKGDAIVFIHGFCEDSSVWEEFIPAFSKNKIIRIDLPGFGFSDPVKNVTIEYMADCVKGVLDELNIQQCVMIGHSMGGYVSLAFAKKYESNLIGLGMFHSHPYADSDMQKAGRKKAIEFIRKNGHILFVKQLVPKLFSPSFASSNNFLVNKMTHRASRFSAKGITGGLEAMMKRSDNSEVLTKINCPVLFIVGKKDELIPFEFSTEQTALPQVASIHILENVGHAGMFEAKKETQRFVKTFISFCKDFQKKKQDSGNSPQKILTAT